MNEGFYDMKYTLYEENKIYCNQDDIKKHIAKKFYQDVILESLKNVKFKSM